MFLSMTGMWAGAGQNSQGGEVIPSQTEARWRNERLICRGRCFVNIVSPWGGRKVFGSGSRARRMMMANNARAFFIIEVLQGRLKRAAPRWFLVLACLFRLQRCELRSCVIVTANIHHPVWCDVWSVQFRHTPDGLTRGGWTIGSKRPRVEEAFLLKNVDV